MKARWAVVCTALVFGLPPLPWVGAAWAEPASSVVAMTASPATSTATDAAAAASEAPRLLRVQPPRDSAHHVADIVDYRALIHWPEGWAIDRDGLPYGGRDDQPIELHSHTVGSAPAPDGDCTDCRWLTLRWQVFKGVRQGEDVVLPATAVRLRRGAQHATLTLPPAVLAVFPLIPWEARRDWLDSQRPGWVALPFEPHLRLGEAALAVLLGLLALLGWAWSSGRWLPRSQARPFAQAARTLRRRRRETPLPSVDEADFRVFHRAFDQTTGEVVMPHGLADFFREHPHFSSLASDVQAMFDESQRLCFLDPDRRSGTGLPVSTLLALTSRLAQAEFAQRRSRRASTRSQGPATPSTSTKPTTPAARHARV